VAVDVAGYRPATFGLGGDAVFGQQFEFLESS
jgi:hypothetical protein